MIPYRYVKRPPKNLSSGKTNFVNPKLISGLLVLAGFFFFLNAAYPLISYQLLISPRFTSTLVSPTSESAIAQSFGGAQDKSFGAAQDKSSGVAQDKSSSTAQDKSSGTQETNQIAENRETKTQANILGTEIDLVDYTKASTWFPTEEKTFVETGDTSYLLSIPKLNISEAKVLVGMEDLKKSLIQYPGSAIPGKYGNTVIFGHSVLPQFFNPKNYLTIFSTLPTLKIGDQILLDYNQISYKYSIEQMIEVAPDDISILAQRYDDSYLTLITCVPPGTYLRRLIIRARLNKI